jgi:hypothetical protein
VIDMVRLVDRLEASAGGYLVLEDVQRAAGQDLSKLVTDGVLLVDYRQRLDAGGGSEPVRLCRLNRHHPLVRRLAGWDG